LGSITTFNACHNGLGEMATFLSVFSKKVTACPIPIAGTGYGSFIGKP
jgi:hypothetical protein